MPDLRRMIYPVQARAIGDLIRSEGPGHWSVLGPRFSDGRILIIHRTEHITRVWLMSHSGVLTTDVGPGVVDPTEFGARAGVSLG